MGNSRSSLRPLVGFWSLRARCAPPHWRPCSRSARAAVRCCTRPAFTRPSRKLELAREENARWYAPYEYYFAEAHFQQSERLAAESAYEDAIRYAKIAEDFSGRALEITRRKRMTER